MMSCDNIKALFEFYGININVSSVNETGFFIVYDIIPCKGATLSKIKRVLPDVSALAKSRFILDTSNGIQLKKEKTNRNIIYSCDFISDITNGKRSEILPLMLGVDENGKRIFFDLAKMPHLLVAGSTGSGKSVFMHDCILSLLYGAKSALILVDVKRVEMSLYDGIRQLATPICYDTKSTLKILKNLCYEMDSRYIKLQNSGCRNISEYIQKGYTMQYITLVIDELADLVLSDSKIEPYLIRLSQLGRAAGIHLIVATQRPDHKVLSGLIRANVPSRICFAVQKATDSRIILDSSGGENLRGNGDGFFLPIGQKELTRFQAPFTSTEIIKQVAILAKKTR